MEIKSFGRHYRVNGHGRLSVTRMTPWVWVRLRSNGHFHLEVSQGRRCLTLMEVMQVLGNFVSDYAAVCGLLQMRDYLVPHRFVEAKTIVGESFFLEVDTGGCLSRTKVLGTLAGWVVGVDCSIYDLLNLAVSMGQFSIVNGAYVYNPTESLVGFKPVKSSLNGKIGWNQPETFGTLVTDKKKGGG